MIETYKLLTGKYDQQVLLTLPKKVTGEYFTRGNSNKLLVKRCRYELRNNFFTNRIVNMWNSLPDYVVMSDTINTFKNRLDQQSAVIKTHAGRCASLSVSLLTTSSRLSNHFLLYTPIDRWFRLYQQSNQTSYSTTIGNTEIFYFIIVQPTPEPEIRIYV